MRANIIDLSNWKGTVNFDSLKAAGIVGVYNKATENTYHDLTYPVNRTKAANHKMAYGGYLFLHPNKDAANQVREYMQYAKPEHNDLRPVIDIETTDGMTMRQAAVATWDAVLEFRKHGINPILYGNPSYLKPMAAIVPALKKLDVWEANYAPKRLAVPYRVLLWQFSDHYIIGSGKFDGNVMLARNLAALRIGGVTPKKPLVFRIIQKFLPKKRYWVTDVTPTK